MMMMFLVSFYVCRMIGYEFEVTVSDGRGGGVEGKINPPFYNTGSGRDTNFLLGQYYFVRSPVQVMKQQATKLRQQHIIK